MITKRQVESLAEEFQIDGFTVIREYLQLLFLSYLYRSKKADKIYFKGGTAIRLLYGSPRFSEDLDFSTVYKKERIKTLMAEVESEMGKELPGLRIMQLYSGKTGLRFRLKYQPTDLKYPMVIRLDFTEIKNVGRVNVSPLVTKFPISIFPLVSHLTDKEIFGEKIQALLNRDKGRDFFDVWFLLEKGVKFNRKLQAGSILKRIEASSQKKINRDLIRFLPKSQRKIPGMLKKLLAKKIKDLKF